MRLPLLISLPWLRAWNLYHGSPLTAPLAPNLELWFNYSAMQFPSLCLQDQTVGMTEGGKKQCKVTSSSETVIPQVREVSPLLRGVGTPLVASTFSITAASRGLLGLRKKKEQKTKTEAEYFLPFCMTQGSPLSTVQMWNRRLF